MPNFQFEFSRISFWLGFLAATLLWWVVNRIRPILPQLRAEVRQFFNVLSQRNFASVENHLRRETLRAAQKMHLAAPLFALDEVLIQPALLAPPAFVRSEGVVTDGGLTGSSIAEQIMPYLLDWPELAAPFGVPRVSAAEALQSGRSLVIIGPAGSGKTVTLAHLASQICRRDPTLGEWVASVPLLVHAVELNLPAGEAGDPLEVLFQTVATATGGMMQTQIPRFLRSAMRADRRLVLLLDGMDELAPEPFAAAAGWLAGLTRAHPLIQVVTTASPDYLDGLTAAGCYPLAVAGWAQPQRIELARRWGRMWTEVLLPEVKKQSTAADIDPVLMNHWLSGETVPVTPLEWTLRLWGAYAGDLSGSAPFSIVEAHLARFLPDPAFLPALQSLAEHMLTAGSTALNYDAMEKQLSAVRVGQAAAAAPDEPASPDDDSPPSGAPRAKKKSRSGGLTSQGERIIEALNQGSVLIEHPGGKMRFANPVLLAFLAGAKMEPAPSSEPENGPSAAASRGINWPTRTLALQYAAACADDSDWIFSMVAEPQPPLYASLLDAARWLHAAPPAADWRSAVMRGLVGLVQSESAPVGIRAKAIAAFVSSRDPSTNRLFKQLLESKSPTLRRLTLLGCGALGSPQFVSDVLPLLGDRSAVVRSAAVMALGAIPGEPALHALVEVLLNGDEDLRQAAAEALARITPDGHKVLEEAAAENDLLTRRASVFGLVQVREPWARKILEKLAIEDGQWVVRNAAAQALDTFQKSGPVAPPLPPAPSDSPWLLTFASKMGMGLLPGAPATDVLLAVLKSGSPDEQVAALSYLRGTHDESVITAIYEMLYTGDEQVTEPALYTLWWMAASGAKLPAPVQAGPL